MKLRLKSKEILSPRLCFLNHFAVLVTFRLEDQNEPKASGSPETEAWREGIPFFEMRRGEGGKGNKWRRIHFNISLFLLLPLHMQIPSHTQAWICSTHILSHIHSQIISHTYAQICSTYKLSYTHAQICSTHTTSHTHTQIYSTY